MTLHIFIDEFHVFFENEQSAAFFNSAWRQFRKRDAYPTGITQNVEYLLDSVEASTMLSNSEFVVMLNQAYQDREKLGRLLNISDEQMSYITNAQSGCGLIKYGGILVPFVNKMPKGLLYDLNTTGIRIEDGEINIYVPQVFRKEQNYKRDILLFLKSISLIGKPDKVKLNKGSNNLDNVWPINSYLWIIKDYLENGFYYNREKVYSNSYRGKIEWKKTMKQIPIYSDGNIIYDKLVTSKMAASNDLIAQIYKLCLKQSIEKIGWVYNYNLKVDVQQIVSTSEMVATVRKEINNTFDDIKRMRFNHMLKIFKTTEGNKVVSNEYTYGIENYYYVFETMVDKLFDGIKESEKKKYNPNGY